ncbi:DUF393 domain-containing protein [Donghicola sp. C2-DW-16]|uniref:DUF393 domain-containing protein n=1 Tax=Donghicola mangrovi TaxID=2729614 RepID=A0ABX2PHG7_9RHOB|nr:DUF393 domain-containing protein [Donghicola mangrovi]NVO28943.1 DUF393 domain-containing protein [Donghicola mangrovi]
MPPSPSAAEDQKLTVFYDGSCPLCRAECNVYRQTQGAEALRFVDVSDTTSALPVGLGHSEVMARFHVATPDGQVVSGAKAFVEVWARLGRWRHLARVARIPLVLPLMEWSYGVFLKFRPAIVRLFVWLNGATP